MITIRNSVKQKIKDRIPSLMQEALAWMQNKYPGVNFENADYIFSHDYRRSRYFRNEIPNAKYQSPCVCICTRDIMYVYEKKSLGLKRFNLWVGYELQILTALIHELTHHVQYEKKEREGNELDTTKNELDFLREKNEAYYNLFMTEQPKI